MPIHKAQDGVRLSEPHGLKIASNESKKQEVVSIKWNGCWLIKKNWCLCKVFIIITFLISENHTNKKCLLKLTKILQSKVEPLSIFHYTIHQVVYKVCICNQFLKVNRIDFSIYKPEHKPQAKEDLNSSSCWLICMNEANYSKTLKR